MQLSCISRIEIQNTFAHSIIHYRSLYIDLTTGTSYFVVTGNHMISNVSYTICIRPHFSDNSIKGIVGWSYFIDGVFKAVPISSHCDIRLPTSSQQMSNIYQSMHVQMEGVISFDVPFRS